MYLGVWMEWTYMVHTTNESASQLKQLMIIDGLISWRCVSPFFRPLSFFNDRFGCREFRIQRQMIGESLRVERGEGGTACRAAYQRLRSSS